jgi:GNAT superfamily N-acetyltransferase
MAERATIVDRYGDWYTIELFEDDQFFAMRVYRGTQVGYARCIVEDGHVELADIQINGRLERNKFLNMLIRPFRRFMAKNYQSRGIGSKLLKEIISYSREIGAVSINGSLVGHKDLLAKWYSQHGFEVDMSTEKIVLELDAADVESV